MDVILTKTFILTVFPFNVSDLFSNVSSFLLRLLLKLFHVQQVDFFLELTLLKFMSYRLPQSNILQHFICF